MNDFNSPLSLSSSDSHLVEAFQWAKTQALAYVFQGDPVGDWYEAALPGRQAFCMRDVAHQASGAHALGLARFNRNMLHRFAENISASRIWCSYWEIDRRNLPCPVDYHNDHDFWYNLPANFDILDCCWRQYLWTGDRAYLDDPTFRFFYAKSVEEYVRQWDLDRDGLMEYDPENGYCGIASYDEDFPRPLLGGDQVAAQYGGYRAYANLAELDGNLDEAERFRNLAQGLRDHYNTNWWNESNSRFYCALQQDYSFSSQLRGISNFFPLYFEMTEAGRKTDQVLAQAVQLSPHLNVEERSYQPEIFFRYGLYQPAYQELLALCEPNLPRRTYPEVSYAVVGAITSGLMGIAPDARERLVTTLPHLPDEVEWVELDHLPILDTRITLRHRGRSESSITNQGNQPFYWQATFPGWVDSLLVDGAHFPALHNYGPNGQEETYALLRVGRAEQHVARIA